MPCIRCGLISDSDDLISDDRHREPVLLNVYDLYKSNVYTSNFGLGVFHSGVQVYGTEYGYGGHQNNNTGVFDVEPRNETALAEFFNLRDRLRYKRTVRIGYTNFTPDEVVMIKNRLGQKFRGNRYDLIYNNCNHFSEAFTKILCHKTIPAWVNRLAYVTSFIPFIHKIVP